MCPTSKRKSLLNHRLQACVRGNYSTTLFIHTVLQRDPEDSPWRLEAMISILLHATTHVKLDPSLSRPHRHGFV